MVRRRSAAACAIAGSFLIAGVFWITVLFPEIALAEDGELPQVLSHSELAFAVYQGDSIHLEILLRGETQNIRWIKSGSTVCRSLACEFDSSAWGFGTHEIIAILANDKGSRTLTWRIKVLDPPPGYPIGKVAPALVGGDVNPPGLAGDDLRVFALAGRGFRENGQLSEVIGDVPRRLIGTESLKTQVGGILQFGRPGKDEHILPPRSVVRLQLGSDGAPVDGAAVRRLIFLESGSVRSRNFSRIDPVWAVAVGEWLEVTTDSRGDVIVTAVEGDAGPSIKIVLVRGRAKVVRKIPGANGNTAVVSEVLDAGKELVVRSGDPAAKIQEPDPGRVGLLVEQTTPHWVPGRFKKPSESSEPGTGPVAFLQGQPPEDLAMATKQASDLQSLKDQQDRMGRSGPGGDFAASVEAFAAVTPLVEKNKEAALLLGRGLFHVYLHREAARFLKISWDKSRKDDDQKNAAEAAWWLGRMAIANRKWTKAVYWLGEAADMGFSDREGVAYYRGLAEYHLDNKLAARSWFTIALWHETKPDIAESARFYLRELEESRFLALSLGVGAFYDSNLTRAPKAGGSAFGLDFGVPQGRGLTALFKGKFFGFKSGQSAISAGFDTDARFPLGALQMNFARIRQAVDLDVNLAIGEEPWILMSFRPWLAGVFVGTGRAADVVGTDLRVGLPGIYGTFIGLNSQKSADPSPQRQDVLDPYLWQVTGAVDRSYSVEELTIGARPIQLTNHMFELALTRETVRWVEDLDAQTKSTATKFTSAYLWLPLRRTDIRAGLEMQNREFNVQRKDTLSVYDIRWRWFFTPETYQIVKCSFENQSSNDSRRSFNRTVAETSLNMDL